MEQLKKSYRGTNNKNNPIVKVFGTKLTTRQAQIVTLVSKGFPNRYIGEKLNITEKTVKFHLTNIFDNERFFAKGINGRLKLAVHVLRCLCRKTKA